MTLFFNLNVLEEDTKCDPFYIVTALYYFYKGIRNYGFNDAFVGMSNEYKRSWDESKFVIKGKYTNIQ